MRIGYRRERGCVLAYIVGPRNGIREYLGGFIDLEDLEEYCKYLGESYELVELGRKN